MHATSQNESLSTDSSAAVVLIERAARIIENIEWTEDVTHYVPGNIDYELDKAAREIRGLKPAKNLLPSADELEKMAILGSENQCRDMLLNLAKLETEITTASVHLTGPVPSAPVSDKKARDCQRHAFELAYAKLNGSTPNGGWNDFNEGLGVYEEPDTQAAWELCLKFSVLHASLDRNTQ